MRGATAATATPYTARQWWPQPQRHATWPYCIVITILLITCPIFLLLHVASIGNTSYIVLFTHIYMPVMA